LPDELPTAASDPSAPSAPTDPSAPARILEDRIGRLTTYRLRLSYTGSIVAAVLLFLSMTPSLLPGARCSRAWSAALPRRPAT
jgi:uncharacterized membrane protein